jgi:formate hydrogenlyase subunit 3/multisubunit Na+/H+ antiporter MnhD subunit
VIIPYALLQATVGPMVVAALIPLLGKRVGRRLGWIAFGILAYSTFLLLNVGLGLWNGQGQIHEEYFWITTVFNLKFGFLADGLSLPVALIMNILCTAGAVYSIHYIEHRIGQLYESKGTGMYTVYYSIYLLFAVGLMGAALSTNLIELYLFVELALIPSYIMIDLFGYVDRHRIAIMYFIWNHIGAALFLLGIIAAYMGAGSFEISALSTLSGTTLGFWVCFLILVGWLIKMATFGFHVWEVQAPLV